MIARTHLPKPFVFPFTRGLRGLECVPSFALTVLAWVSTPLLAGTKIVYRWVVTDQPMPRLRKILVSAVLENYLMRQEFEDEREELLVKSGGQGIRSHMVLPPRNELMQYRERFLQYLKENTMVSAEFNLYRTKDETLLWSGETDTVYCKDFEKLGKEYAGALIKQLKKDKTI